MTEREKVSQKKSKLKIEHENKTKHFKERWEVLSDKDLFVAIKDSLFILKEKKNLQKSCDDTTTISFRKKFIKIKKASEKLKKCFEDLSPSEAKWIGAPDDPPHLDENGVFRWIPWLIHDDNRNSEQVKVIDEFLENIIFRANRTIDFFSQGSTPGKKEDHRVRLLIELCAVALERWKGIKPSITYNDYKGKYTGELLDFMDNLFKELEITMPYKKKNNIKRPQPKNALGKRIQRVLSK
jgi:hypothetical protein